MKLHRLIVEIAMSTALFGLLTSSPALAFDAGETYWAVGWCITAPCGLSLVASGVQAGVSPTAVVDRSPLYLVGSETFLDEMLESAGAENLARSLGVGYPRASIEWLISARPELLLDMTPGAVGAAAFWT